MQAVLYIHGKGGDPAASEHFKPFFVGYEIIGFEYRSKTPWEAEKEFFGKAEELSKKHEKIVLIADSIGAYFSMCARIDRFVERAYFISPIVDMEKLIEKMMQTENVSEEELKGKGVIPTSFGEDLSWEYLTYVRNHPVEWTAPTQVLCGSKDTFTSADAMRRFTEKTGATLTVMDGGEHWFHTEKQLLFLDKWIMKKETEFIVRRWK